MSTRDSSRRPEPDLTRIVHRTGAGRVRLIPRNFVLAVLNGALVQMTGRLLDPNTVTPLLVVFLTGNEELVGLFVAARMVGTALPQVVMPAVAARMRRKRPLYIISAVARSSMLWLMFVLMLLVDRMDPHLLFGLMAFASLLFSGAVGIGLIAFFDIVARTVPPENRGQLQAHRWFWGGLLGLAGGALVAWLFSEQSPFTRQQGFQILLGLGALLGTAGTVCFCFVTEPEGAAPSRRVQFLNQFRWGRRLLRADRNLGRFIIY